MSFYFEEQTLSGNYITTREILVKKGDKYLCWNSFKSMWFFGKRELSERLTDNQAKELALKYNAKVVTPIINPV